MTSFQIKNLLLISATALVIFYLMIVSVNLGLRLTTTRQPECQPLFCNRIENEASYCLISTPGAENCLKIAGQFFVPSLLLAYGLLILAFGISFYISKRFYLSRWLIILVILALVIYFIRIALGAATLTPAGLYFEFQKLGLMSAYTDMFSREI